jgi:hypothetical protein
MASNTYYSWKCTVPATRVFSMDWAPSVICSFEELKGFIQWLDHQYSIHGFIPNAAPAGSDSYFHHNGNNGGGPGPEANAAGEVTALYLLAARDYFNPTHDRR